MVVDMSQFLQAEKVKKEIDRVEEILSNLSSYDSMTYITFKDRSSFDMLGIEINSEIEDVKIDEALNSIITRYYRDKLNELKVLFDSF